MKLITDPGSDGLANGCYRDVPLDFDGGFLDIDPPGEFIGPPTKQEWYGDCLSEYWYGNMSRELFWELTGILPDN